MRRQGLAIASPKGSDVRRVARFRWRIVVFPALVFAVHQLSYLLSYGSDAGTELSEHGDHYVATAAIAAAALAASSLAVGLVRLLGAWRGRTRPVTTSLPLWLGWLGWTLALVAGFCALEGLEIVLEPHHVGGVVGVFGNDGWWALPAAAFVGSVMTLLLRGGHALLGIVTRSRGSRRVRTASVRHPGRLASESRRRPMASCAPGRAPPVVESV
jgi:hypothetical protein